MVLLTSFIFTTLGMGEVGISVNLSKAKFKEKLNNTIGTREAGKSVNFSKAKLKKCCSFAIIRVTK